MSSILLYTSLLLLALCWSGCKSSESVKTTKESKSDVKTFLAQYEKTFTPSQYNPDVRRLLEEEQQQYATLHPANVITTAVPETIPGFRIQVLLTQEIDRANAVRDSVETQLPQELIYVVYDAPYYKVRVGNYPDRPTANPALKKLILFGYKESWIVPDNVLKNPPPKLPDEFIEPQQHN